MNVRELRAELRRRRVDDWEYVLEGLRTDSPTEGATYVVRSAGGWEVGVQERGKRDPYATFRDEDSACRFALKELSRLRSGPRRPWYLRWM